LGINFFWILGYSSTYLLFHSYECKKVSGRFPDVGCEDSDQSGLCKPFDDVGTIVLSRAFSTA